MTGGVVPSRGSPDDSLLLLISETLRAGSNAPAPMYWAGKPSGVVVHRIKVVRHCDSDRHAGGSSPSGTFRVGRSAGLIKQLGGQIARAVRVRAVGICPELWTDVNTYTIKFRWCSGPGLAAVEGLPDVEVVAVVAVASSCPVG